MFNDLVNTLGNIAKDSIDIVSAPINVAAKVTREVTKPIATCAKEIETDITDFFK
jgi:hypothetical protein